MCRVFIRKGQSFFLLLMPFLATSVHLTFLELCSGCNDSLSNSSNSITKLIEEFHLPPGVVNLKLTFRTDSP